MSSIPAIGRTTTIPCVDAFIRAEEEHHEAEIEVEVEKSQVGTFDLRDPHADKIFGDVFKFVETDNLPVEFGTTASGYSAEDNH